MRVRVEGSQLDSFCGFLRELAAAAGANEPLGMGWDLHSLRDSLFGGYASGPPPYHVLVVDADELFEGLGYGAMVQYCEQMIEVARAGGRGLVDRASIPWFEDARDEALRARGMTLLQHIGAAFESAGGTLTLRSRDGAVLFDV